MKSVIANTPVHNRQRVINRILSEEVGQKYYRIEGKREREREGEVAWEGDIEGLISNVRGNSGLDIELFKTMTEKGM